MLETGKTVRGKIETVKCRKELGGELRETADRLGDKQTQRERRKSPCDNIAPMDMNMMMNCVVRFKSNPVVLSLMFTTQSQQGLEATLALSIISLSSSLSLSHTHTHTHQQL